MARKKRDYQAEYARRIKRNLARGKSVQQARGHKGGDRGKVATRKRGSSVVPIREKLTYQFGAQTNVAIAFNFAGRDEAIVLRDVRAYADPESKKLSRRRPPKVLIYRFKYRDIKYVDADRRSNDDMWATSSRYNVYHNWGIFMSDYQEIKARAIDNVVGSVLFGYTESAEHSE